MQGLELMFLAPGWRLMEVRKSLEVVQMAEGKEELINQEHDVESRKA